VSQQTESEQWSLAHSPSDMQALPAGLAALHWLPTHGIPAWQSDEPVQLVRQLPEAAHT
jgi:hypothetical protein